MSEKVEVKDTLSEDRIKLLHEYGIDIKTRRIYFSGVIDDDTVEIVAAQIHMFSDIDPHKKIELVINSIGGYDDATFFLYDAIVNSKAPVVTVGSGMVCSAASLILACGDQRYATENCWLMTHKGEATIEGDDDEVISQVELQVRCADRFWKLLERHSSRRAIDWYRQSKNVGELWLNAAKMLDYGIVDGIISPSRRNFDPLSKRIMAPLSRRLKVDDEDDEEEQD